jgi:uncharacterized protein YcfJ
VFDCSDHQDVGTKQGVGTVLGATGGGLLGNQFGKDTGNVVATAAGVFLGGLLGNSIGKSLDSADRAAQDQAASRAARRADPLEQSKERQQRLSDGQTGARQRLLGQKTSFQLLSGFRQAVP